MPIQLIARDLYRLQQEVETLEKELNSTPMGHRGELKEQLRKIRAERDRMHKILEGTKEPPSVRKPR